MRLLSTLFTFGIVLLPAIALASDATSAAKDYCRCATPMYQDLEKMMQGVRNGDMSGLQDMQANMQSKMVKLETCMGGLKDKYEHLKGDEQFEQEVKDEIEKACPRPNLGLPGMG